MRPSSSFFIWMAVALACSTGTRCAKILAVETIGGKSHWNVMSGVLRALVDGGHDVTVFTPFVDGDRENYTEVDISAGFPTGIDLDVLELLRNFGNPMRTLQMFVEMGRSQCDIVYGNAEMRRVLDSPRGRFDAVVIEPFWSDCASWSYVAAKLGLPLIHVTPLPVIAFAELAITGHLSSPAAVSNLLARHAVPGTFVQRLTNAALLAYGAAVQAYKELVIRYTAVPTAYYDAGAAVPPSLVFLNSHFVLDAARPTAAHVVHVGGIHLKAPQSLPKDILEFIEESPHGIIYFTFGSCVKMSTLPEHVKTSFIEALAQVPQRVLLKYEDKMENKPKNMMMKNWLPQRDILLHPKVKLFISHGGISGLYESVDAGVPVLGFPLIGDQPRNMEHLVNAGMAISMDLLSVSKDTLLKNILEIINNEKYAENAKNASEIFKDRPMSPAELVVYWTEYVIRHKGAPHLKSHAFNLTWYQYFLLDVISIVLIFSSVVLFLTYKLFKCINRNVLKYSHSIKTKSE